MPKRARDGLREAPGAVEVHLVVVAEQAVERGQNLGREQPAAERVPRRVLTAEVPGDQVLVGCVAARLAGLATCSADRTRAGGPCACSSRRSAPTRTRSTSSGGPGGRRCPRSGGRRAARAAASCGCGASSAGSRTARDARAVPPSNMVRVAGIGEDWRLDLRARAECRARPEVKAHIGARRGDPLGHLAAKRVRGVEDRRVGRDRLAKEEPRRRARPRPGSRQAGSNSTPLAPAHSSARSPSASKPFSASCDNSG